MHDLPRLPSAVLLMEVGLIGAMLTGDLFTLFVFMELMVLASVSLTAISDDQYGLEAALKYILISSMGTLFLLLGIGALYATFGTLNMAEIAGTLLTGERPVPGAGLSDYAALRLSAERARYFPFHFWQPDFHTTAPTPISAMLSSIVVKVGVYGIFRLVTLLFIEEAPLLERWLSTLGIIGILFGSLGALAHLQRQTHAGIFDICPDRLYPGRHRLGKPLALLSARLFTPSTTPLSSRPSADADGRGRQLYQDENRQLRRY